MKNRLKQIIFDKLYNDLKHLEIIPYRNSVWFIDRKEKYWHLEYEKSGELWWRWLFFSSFFALFSMERNEYEPIISEWVEEVLNCKVKTSMMWAGIEPATVEEVLNCKVNRSRYDEYNHPHQVEEVLNYKVKKTWTEGDGSFDMVEEVLNHKNN